MLTNREDVLFGASDEVSHIRISTLTKSNVLKLTADFTTAQMDVTLMERIRGREDVARTVKAEQKETQYHRSQDIPSRKRVRPFGSFVRIILVTLRMDLHDTR